ncbi:UNVERIFIED_CONTAM: hypothetical protein Slati_3820900 [Sesamum latifolium]|uniref:Retrotransposon gag domain-containing protein n=1 Tax=Sesamum latifolium TaxID=2727402 RepID=A0AAW2U6K6_9LAMI
MENPSNTANKQKTIETSSNNQALQVATGMSLTKARGGSVPTPPPPRAIGPVTDPLRRSTSSNTSTDDLSPAMLGAIQSIVSAAIREQIVTLAPPRTSTPSDVGVPEEEAEEACALQHLQKALQDVRYQKEGTPEDEQQGVPFTEAVMADELPVNCRTPAIAEYDGTMDPMEHLSRFETTALLHRYTDGIKCRVFITTFTRSAQQWFNQLPVRAIGNFQEFRSLFLHQVGSNRKLHKTGLSLFVAVRQKDNEPLKEYLQRCSSYQERESRKKQKETKEEASSKKPRVDMRDKKPPFQRVNTVYTPLTVAITQALMAVEGKGLLARPRS